MSDIMQPAFCQALCYKQPFIELYNEDCLKTLKRIQTGSVDLILQDPPYGALDLNWDNPVDYNIMFSEWFRVLKENGVILIFSQQPYATDVICACRKSFRYEIIWEKTQKLGFVNANKMPLKGHENILVFYKKLPVYNPQKVKVQREDIGRVRKQDKGRYKGYSEMGECTYVEDGFRHPSTVIKFSNWNGALFGNNNNATIHPTQKPIDLFRWLIKSYSNENDLVFDGYSGSGTTAAACLKEKRRFIGSELSKEYFDLSVKRLEEIKAKPELF